MPDKNKEQVAKAVNNNIPNHISTESAIGSVLLIATKSPTHKYLFSQDYEWMIIPPITAKQYSLFRNKRKEPIAFVSFASVSEEVEKRLLDGSLKLNPEEWVSGNKLYIIDIISPFIPIPDIFKELDEGQFKDKDIKILKPNKGKKGMTGIVLKDAVKEINYSQIKTDKK